MAPNGGVTGDPFPPAEGGAVRRSADRDRDRGAPEEGRELSPSRGGARGPKGSPRAARAAGAPSPSPRESQVGAWLGSPRRDRAPAVLRWAGLSKDVAVTGGGAGGLSTRLRRRRVVGDLEAPEPAAEAKRRTRRVLFAVSGVAQPGEVLALMGPSGSGKTTLLNCLHPERAGSQVSGAITINDAPLVKADKRRIAYVLQDDTLFPSLTVRESLLFTARLRLAGADEKAKAEAVDAVITQLSLGRAANNTVALCSGGEKKRVSISIELLTDPTVLLLDEPTSGLDSTTSGSLLRTLLALAREHSRTVVTSIHQPSSMVYLAFDRVLMLCDGHVVFDGPPGKTLSYLEAAGFACDAPCNPADFVMDLLIGDGADANRKLLIDAYAARKRPLEPSSEGSGDNWPTRAMEAAKGADPGAPPPLPSKWATGWWYQTAVLTRRSFFVAKSAVLSWISLFECAALTLVTGLLFFQLPWDASAVSAR